MARPLHVTSSESVGRQGRALTARIEGRGRELALLVCDLGATYPITIDPLFATIQSKLAENHDYSGNLFGSSVALDGETAADCCPR